MRRRIEYGVEYGNDDALHACGHVGPEMVGERRCGPGQFHAQQSGDGSGKVGDGVAAIVGQDELLRQVFLQAREAVVTNGLFDLCGKVHLCGLVGEKPGFFLKTWFLCLRVTSTSK